jgi:dimethylargininase
MENPFEFKYTHAVVSRLPTTLKEATFRKKDFRSKTELINIEKAIETHNEYIMTLRKLGVDVIELQADDTLPDSAFVECCAVICNGTALMGKPHLVSRNKEVDVIRSVLKKEGLNIVDINDPVATVDGSDVLFTGLIRFSSLKSFFYFYFY